MRGRKIVAAVVLAAVAALTGVIPAGADNSPSEAEEAVPAGRPVRGADEAVDTGYVFDGLDVEGLEVTLTLEHADSFAGISVDEQRQVATIHYRSGSDLAWLDEELAAIADEPFHDTRVELADEHRSARGSDRARRPVVPAQPPGHHTPSNPYRIHVQPEERSLAELDAERQKVADSEVGDYIVLDQVIAEENRIDVTLHALPQHVRVAEVYAEATDAAAPTAVDVDVDWSIAERPTNYVNRQDDVRPHKAGLRIVGPRGQLCAGGPSVRPTDSTHRTMLTAAHCGPRRSRWESPNGMFVGFVAQRAFGNGYFDSAVLRKPNFAKGFAPRMFGGGQDSSELHPVRGALFAKVGGQVCTSGASFGDQCNGAQVQQRNVCASFTDINKRTCFLNLADQTGAGPGDSGGPVYRQTASGRLVAGTIVGGNDDWLLYHPIGHLLRRWDAVLVKR